MACDAVASIPMLGCCAPAQQRRVMLCGTLTGFRFTKATLDLINTTCEETATAAALRSMALSLNYETLRLEGLPLQVVRRAGYSSHLARWTGIQSGVSPTVTVSPNPGGPNNPSVTCGALRSHTVISEGRNESIVELGGTFTDTQALDEMLATLAALPFPAQNEIDVFDMANLNAPNYSGPLANAPTCGVPITSTVVWWLGKHAISVGASRCTRTFVMMKTKASQPDGWCSAVMRFRIPFRSSSVVSCAPNQAAVPDSTVFFPLPLFPPDHNDGHAAMMAVPPGAQAPFPGSCCTNPFA